MEIQQLSKICIHTYNNAVNCLGAGISLVLWGCSVPIPPVYVHKLSKLLFWHPLHIIWPDWSQENNCNLWFELWLLSFYQKWRHGSHRNRLLSSRSKQWPSLFRPVSCSCSPAINYLWDQQKADCDMRAHLRSKKWTRYTWPQIWHSDDFISILEWEELEKNEIIGYKL